MSNNNEACTICCENYTDLTIKIRDKKCSFCFASFCTLCIRRFLTEYSKLNPSCPSCSHEWTMEFIYSITPSSFYNQKYRDYRNSIVMEREISLLPATQQKMDNEKERLLSISILRTRMYDDVLIIKNLEKIISDIGNVIYKLTVKNNENNRMFKGSIPNTDGVVIQDDIPIHNMNNFLRSLSDNTVLYHTKIVELQTIKKEYENKYENEVVSLSTKERRVNQIHYIKNCIVDDCRGFIKQSDYKCTTCEIKICDMCHEIKNDDHICNPSTVETVTAISKETTRCPTCYIPIFKSDGCDQMWCIQCKTPFSFRTGKIENGRVHNPHYYEWQRTLNNGVIPRVEEVVNNCEFRLLALHRCNYNSRNNLTDVEVGLLTDALNLMISNFHRNIVHIETVELVRFPNNTQTYETNEKLRIDYLSKYITKEQWSSSLKRQEKKREKDTRIHMIISVYINVMKELYIELINSYCKYKFPISAVNKDILEDIFKKIETFTVYINNQLTTVSNVFKCVNYQVIDEVLCVIK